MSCQWFCLSFVKVLCEKFSVSLVSDDSSFVLLVTILKNYPWFVTIGFMTIKHHRKLTNIVTTSRLYLHPGHTSHSPSSYIRSEKNHHTDPWPLRNYTILWTQNLSSLQSHAIFVYKFACRFHIFNFFEIIFAVKWSHIIGSLMHKQSFKYYHWPYTGTRLYYLLKNLTGRREMEKQIIIYKQAIC